MRLVIFIVLATPLALLPLPGCKKEVPPASWQPAPAAAVSDAPPTLDSAPAAAAAIARNFERVYFALDSASLDGPSKDALRANAALMSAHPGIKVEIQGHCDEQGTTEYNLALGEKRASAVRAYLEAVGVPPGRLSTISFGEERPASPGAGETVWAQNRRAEFRITLGTESPVAGTVP